MSRKRTATARNKTTAGGGSNIELLNRLGLAVRVARIGRGMSQRELGQRIGKSQNLVFTIESGQKDPGVLLLSRIADVVEMPLEFFLLSVQKARATTPTARKRDFEQGREILHALMEAVVDASDDPGSIERNKKSKPRDSRTRVRIT